MPFEFFSFFFHFLFVHIFFAFHIKDVPFLPHNEFWPFFGPSSPLNFRSKESQKEFFFLRRQGERSQSVPETLDAGLTKAWGHALLRMEGGPNRPRAPPARSHKRTFPGFPSKLTAYARWMEQASNVFQRWKNRRRVERRRTLGTERDKYHAKFLKNVTALGLHHPATSNAITRKWHLVPVSTQGTSGACPVPPRGWLALACDPSPRPNLST